MKNVILKNFDVILRDVLEIDREDLMDAFDNNSLNFDDNNVLANEIETRMEDRIAKHVEYVEDFDPFNQSVKDLIVGIDDLKDRLQLLKKIKFIESVTLEHYVDVYSLASFIKLNDSLLNKNVLTVDKNGDCLIFKNKKFEKISLKNISHSEFLRFKLTFSRRKKFKLYQSEMALKLGVSVRTYKSIELGEIDIDTLYQHAIENLLNTQKKSEILSSYSLNKEVKELKSARR